MPLAHAGERLGAVGGLAGQLHVARVGEHLLDALADDLVVVADQHADHGVTSWERSVGKGMVRRTRVPRPGWLSMAMRPPKWPARSRMPITP